jgi:hypothetical protein
VGRRRTPEQQERHNAQRRAPLAVERAVMAAVVGGSPAEVA